MPLGSRRTEARPWHSARRLQRAGNDASIHQGNVGDPEHCLRVVGEVIDRHGRLDILVNNAGITVDRPVSTMTVDDWHKVLRVNLSGAFYMSQPALAHMLERGSGRIINISSVVGETGQHRPGQLRRLEVRPPRTHEDAGPGSGVRAPQGGQARRGGIGLTVNAVTPGLIESEMTAAVPPKVIEKLTAAIPLRRMGRPEEVARVVRFLAADSSGYITGQVWGVNGGFDM